MNQAGPAFTRNLVRCLGLSLILVSWGCALEFNKETSSDTSLDTSEPEPVFYKVTDFDVGTNSACAILETGALKCWGGAGPTGFGSWPGNTLGSEDSNHGDEAGETPAALSAISFGAGRTVSSLTAGAGFACALLDNGKVKCWGSNVYGQLGLGDIQTRGGSAGHFGDSMKAVDLGTGRTAKALSAGSSHVCAILDNDRVKCWGTNYYGELGLGDVEPRGDESGEMGNSLPYVDLGTGRTAKAIAAGGSANCVILDTDRIKCWGGPWYGLGYGDLDARGDGPGEMGDSLPYVDLGTDAMADPHTVKKIALGYGHFCAILGGDTLKCWGGGFWGYLGYGDTQTRGDAPGEMGDTLPNVDIGTDGLGTNLKAVDISLGNYHTCVLLDSQQVKCWGVNNLNLVHRGQLGRGSTVQLGDGAGEMGDSLTPIDFGALRTVTALSPMSPDANHACVLLDNGQSKCWGSNVYGQLGLGDVNNRGDQASEMGDDLSALDFGVGFTVASLHSSGGFTCALSTTGKVKCWGTNVYGVSGQGSNASHGDGAKDMGNSLPAVRLGTSRVPRNVRVSNQYSSSCAILDDGSLKCWGMNANGSLGLGDTVIRGDQAGTMGDNLPAVDLGSSRVISKVDLGHAFACSLFEDGDVKCWGWGNAGRTGASSTVSNGDAAGEMGDSLTPVNLGTGVKAKDISLGSNHACVITTDDEVKCWGANWAGQLGYGDTAQRGHSAATMGDSLPSVILGTGVVPKKVSLGGFHSCILSTAGKLKCWGYNGSGQLGQGDADNRGNGVGPMGDGLPYLDFGAGRTVVDFDVGGTFGCALLDDGGVKCWGHNGYSQLGVGTSWETDLARGDEAGEMGSALPYVDLGGAKATKVRTGNTSVCALLENGRLKCWGNNSLGQLGIGSNSIMGDSTGTLGTSLPFVDLGSYLP